MPIKFAQQLKGRTVLDGSGNVIGSLEELLIDSDTLQIEGLRVRLTRDASKDIGAHGSLFHAAVVDIPRAAVRAAGDAVILAATRSDLHEMLSRWNAGTSQAALEEDQATYP
ncbi:MAG TPA: PRC-barrel domain-containing protein [Polyangia bacterium]